MSKSKKQPGKRSAPPGSGAYWVIGYEPSTTTAPGRMRMVELRNGEPPPDWATYWCRKGDLEWNQFPIGDD